VCGLSFEVAKLKIIQKIAKGLPRFNKAWRHFAKVMNHFSKTAAHNALI
jgi:hypothetical protein